MTAADFAAIAVAPLLVFVMISSLANFLVLALYDGEFPSRVSWVMWMYTMGVVGIARVAIEQSRAYSLAYAAALGLAALVVMGQFVNSIAFCAFILLVIGYLADVIVRDCTLIDDSVDVSGQGLIDSGRLFAKRIQRTVAASNRQLDTTDDTSGHAPSKPANSRRRGRQPGRTILFLAAAALPLFGIGQMLLRNDSRSWDEAKFLLALYLFSSLSLLVTTSFLGLRRYLRQRRASMPTSVSVAWLSSGMLLIGVVLVVAAVAPVPGRALLAWQPPKSLEGSSELRAHRRGWGNEGAQKSTPDAAGTIQDADDSTEQEVQGEFAAKDAPAGNVGEGQRKQGPAGNQDGGKSPAESQAKPQQGKTNSKAASPPASRSSPETGQTQRDQPERDQDERTEPSRKQASGPAPKQTPAQTGPRRTQRPSQTPSSAATPPPSPPPTSSLANLLKLGKAIVIAALAAVVGWFLWSRRQQIARWWHQIFSGRDDSVVNVQSADSVAQERSAPPRLFSSFRNPLGRSDDPRRIVVTTFQAFEAWTRERGVTRSKDETPSEFLRRATHGSPALAATEWSNQAAQLVDAYNRIVYGDGAATDRDIQAAGHVWQQMESETGQINRVASAPNG